MKKTLLLSLLLSFVMTIGAAETPKEKYGTFSVIGDSYSTFMGFTDPLGNAQWYPHAGNAMASVEQTWWKLFERESGVELVQNNSFSGSTICTHSWGNTTDLVNSFVGRVDNLSEAGLIIVEGATNDNNAGSALGEYVWSDFTDAHKRTFRGGTAYVIDFLQKKYPRSQIIFMLNSGLRADINESVQVVCDHYNVPVLKLAGITKIEDHPDLGGMVAIKEQLMAMLCEMNGIGYISEESKVNVTEARDNTPVMVNKQLRGNRWNSICLPFALAKNQISGLFGENARVQAYAGQTDGVAAFSDVEAMEANTPYLLMPEQDVTAPFLVESVSLQPSQPVTVGDADAYMTGLYEPMAAYKRGENRYALSYTGTLCSSVDASVTYPVLSAMIRTGSKVKLTGTDIAGYTAPSLPLLDADGLFTPVHASARMATAVPVITADPFLSLWSHETDLADGATKHMTGDDTPLEGYVEVDGTLYRFLGTGTAEAVRGIMGSAVETVAVKQTACNVTATQTYLDFEAGDVAVSVLFSAPQIITDAASLGAAVNYISYRVNSLDGAPHRVRLHLAASANIVRSTSGDGVSRAIDQTEGVSIGRIGRSTQSMVENRRPNWGYLMLMADGARGQQMANTTKFLLFTDDMGETVSDADYTLIGRDENNMAVGFGYARFPAPWVRAYTSFGQLMMAYASDVNERLQACREFDSTIYNDAREAAGSEYASLCAATYRQAVSACKQALSDTGDVLLYNVDAGNSWQISQADQIFAAAPLFLAYNPELAYTLFESVPNYIKMYPGFSSPFGNAPHHLGVWPIMAGSHLDHGVDATTDMCIVAGAAVKCGMDASAISDYSYDYLTSLCRYLDLFTLPQYIGNFPGEGSADGFIRNSANLRIKSVLAMSLVSYIAGQRGNTADEAFYQEMAGRWEEIFRTTYDAGDHYRQGDQVEWGQKYPLFYDKALGLDIFPDVIATELAYYSALPSGEYGLPLDGRSESSAKLSATMLTAAMSGDFISYFPQVAAFMKSESSMAPVANLYDCQTGEATGAVASGAVASLWAPVLIHRLGTGCSSVDTIGADAHTERATGIFDLQGRRLSSIPTTPGIYIVNGHKTLVR